ncbi:MAG: patatin-like phospholipase family protein [Myxococcota bacterium]
MPIRLALVALVALLARGAAPLAAQPAPADAEPAPEPAEPAPAPAEPEEHHDIAMVISGGVSLGAYEAGYLHLATEAAKHSGGRLHRPLYTGASAGSANAFLAALQGCMEPVDDPTASWLWETWIPMGHRELFDPAQVEATHIFTRDPLEATIDRLRPTFAAGLPEDCDVVVGITVTRVEGFPVRLHEALELPRLSAKFAFRMQGRGPGVPPRISNYLDPDWPLPHPLLPFREGTDEATGNHNLDLIRDLSFASGAFPGAFAPVRMRFCMSTDPGQDAHPLECTDPPHESLFIDGGVLDNNPLRFARRLGRFGLRRVPGEEARWRDADAEGAPGSGPAELVFEYLDPDTTNFPELETDEPLTGNPDLLDLLGHLAGEFVTTARSQELYALAESEPDLIRQLLVTERNYPTFSQLLYAFLGFFEREFREFDFYLGMYDAYAESARALDQLGEPQLVGTLGALERAFDGATPETLAPEWKPFACMLGWFEPGSEHWRPACNDPELNQFRNLLQVSLDRLYARCSTLAGDEVPAPSDHFHCHRAAQDRPSPRIITYPEDERPDRRAPGEGDFEHALRILQGYRFHFRDLSLRPDQSRFGLIKVRRKLLGMIDALADAQPSGATRIALLTGGRAVVNDIAYEPPKNWFYGVVGNTFEVGASVLPFEWNKSWLRISLALQIDSLRTIADDDRTVAFSTLGGVELELLPITTPIIQPMLGVRGGYQVGIADRAGRRPCRSTRLDGAGNVVPTGIDDNRQCTQPVAQAYAALAIIERLRVQFGVSIFPRTLRVSEDDAVSRIQLELGVGFQLF